MSENANDGWTIPIKIGMWTMYSVAIILVIVVVMMNA
ncbi:hypothetical protein BH11MYX1_BH11MYX1_00490 [soil metagenome]